MGPATDLEPDTVVGVQLSALAAGDVAGVWAFASPGNREAVGPLERFADLLRNPLYAPLLGHASAVLGESVREAGDARVEVLVHGAAGEVASYTWVLSVQAGGPWDGCWMTDGVLRH